MLARQRLLALTLLGSVLSLAGSGVGLAETELVVEQLNSATLPGLRAEVATLIMQGASGGAIDLAVSAHLDRRATAEGKYGLHLVVEASGDSLVSAAENVTGPSVVTVELYVYVVDIEGLVVAHLARRVPIDMDRWGERLFSGGARFVEELEVPDGVLSIRSLVLLPDTDRFGMVLTEVEPRATVSGFGRPRFEEVCGDWLPVVPRGSRNSVRSSARPLWRVGEIVTAVVAGEDESETELPLFGLLESQAGEVSRVEARVEHLDRSLRAGELEVRLEVPEVNVGVYSFTLVRGEDSGTDAMASEIWIVPPSPVAAESACAWPEVVQEAKQQLADIGPVGPSEGRGRSSSRETSKGYLNAVSRLGNGADLKTAVDGLVEWEASVVGEEVRKNLRTLMLAQVEVLQALAKSDPESLLPVFRLHEAAYVEHFRRRNFALAGHSRRLTATAAEIWLARPERGEEASWVADALVSLAETADRHLMFAVSQGFLERAVEVDPRNRAGRLLLAMLYEKLGEYESATDHLEELVASRPADAEGWLRLATLQRRLGDLEASRESLRQVIGLRPRPWILSLAYQTLIKELYADGSFGEGMRVLDEAEFLLPGDSTLRLARAYGLDRLGHGREAVEVLKALSAEPGSEASFRLFYAQAAKELAQEVNARLRRNVLIRRPLLDRAVEQLLSEAR